MTTTAGLHRVGRVWHIDKTVRFGQETKRIRMSTGCASLDDATLVLAKEIERARDEVLYGKRQTHTFQEAADRYLAEQATARVRSVDRQHQNLNSILPVLGKLDVNEIHQAVIDPWIEQQRGHLRSGTITRILRVVTAVLNRCWRVYRDGSHPWLQAVPLLACPDMNDTRQPYPLDWTEQQALLSHMPAYLARMSEFCLYTGCRDQEVCHLRWEWEQGDVFVLPSTTTKNKEDRIVVIGRVARTVVEAQRGESGVYVFPSQKNGGRISKMNNKSWRKAWRDAGLPTDADVMQGPHNLRHTFARRLRAAGVPLETRRTLLGHKNGDITTHYSAAEIRELMDAINSINNCNETPLLRAIK